MRSMADHVAGDLLARDPIRFHHDADTFVAELTVGADEQTITAGYRRPVPGRGRVTPVVLGTEALVSLGPAFLPWTTSVRI